MRGIESVEDMKDVISMENRGKSIFRFCIQALREVVSGMPCYMPCWISAVCTWVAAGKENICMDMGWFSVFPLYTWMLSR